ncbi:uncharacterized protein N7529_004067 [Penicillium soppii]|uniref:uncharacterized protein n=1 Tax=Penicillium soppii TaxID=69789 RepID=UPI002549A9B9|nr:uncharacterized protein N7529_004067 [Penicillium soppii]KAJ5871714.1 hypothetical protein N7529_004067 [Penicillium soppii]
MIKTVESTATMTTNDSPPPYQIDTLPLYSPITCKVLSNPVLYHINRPLNDYELYSEDEALAFYIQVHSRSISKPDLRIYRRDKGSGQKIAECRYGEEANPIQSDSGWLRQSNPSHHLGGKMTVAWWTRSTRDSPHAVNYRFAALIESQSDMIEEEPIMKTPKTFTWMKTSNLELLDEETGTVAAIFHENQSDSPGCGTLEIIASYDNEFNLIVLSTLVALIEKQRRHRKRFSGDRAEENLRGTVGGIMGALKRG